MKANSALFLIILLLFILSACVPAEPVTEDMPDTNIPSTVASGTEKLEDDDTAELKAGYTEGEAESAGYVVVSDLNTKFNEQAYDKFISDVIEGKEAFVRTVYFRDGELVSYVDVTSKDGVITRTVYDINDVFPGEVTSFTYEKLVAAKKFHTVSENNSEYSGYFYLVNGDMKLSEIDTIYSPYLDNSNLAEGRKVFYRFYIDKYTFTPSELELIKDTEAAEKAFDNFYENGKYTYAESIYYPVK